MKKLLVVIIIITLLFTVLFSVIFFNVVLNKKFLNLRPYGGLDPNEFEWVSIINDDLKLQGYLKEDSSSDKYAILVHGYTGTGATMLEYDDYYVDNNYNILIIDHRIHGNSDGQYCTMGIKETEDLLLWIDFIVSRNPKAKIVLHGISMGAATIMMATGSEEIPSNVVAAIEDCGFTSVIDEFGFQIKQRIGIEARLLIKASSIYAKIKAGFFYGENSPIEAVKRSKIPTLFIHGSTDDFVPFYMLQELYDSASCPKKILVIENAEHVMSHIVDPDKYWSTVDSFLKNIFN